MARQQAEDNARQEVIAALVPICLEQARRDPDQTAMRASLRTAMRASLRDARGYRQRQQLMATGCATMPGADAADRGVAAACMDRHTAAF